MKHLLLCICYITSLTLQAQKVLRGKLLSADDNKPIPSASIYLSNTVIGTVSQEDGSFTISPFPEGQYDLVVSSLGYETHIRVIKSTELPDNLTIALNRKVEELDNITVEPFLKNGWRIWGSFFMEYLIGQTTNAKDCKLLNKNAVRFRVKQIPVNERILEAVSSEPLIIENKALGYTLTYDLEFFSIKLYNYSCTYEGYPFFKEMEAPDEKTKGKWMRNRQEAYQGSVMHFMRSVYRNQLAEEGFTVKRILSKRPKTITAPEKADSIYLTGDSIAYSIDSNTVQLQFTDLIEVVYAAKKATPAYIKAVTFPTIPPETYIEIPGHGMVRPTGKQIMSLHSSVARDQPLTAQLKLRKSGEGVLVLHNGHHYYSNNLLTMLYWSWSEKLSNLLPLDYGNPTPVNAEQVYKPQ